jgi:hypothetical protein
MNSSSIQTIDYRFEDGRFPVSASCVSISNPDSLSSSETTKTVKMNVNICKYSKDKNEY